MQFEWDAAKSAGNKAKHGLDFIAAQELWAMPHLIIPLPYATEPRRAVVGQIKGQYWTAIITQRGAATRIISVRRARKQEIEAYENDNIS